MPHRIGLICDSTADFPPGLEKDLGLHILPVHIMVDGQDYLHGQSISNKEVVEALRQKRDVFTKPFYPHECADVFEKLLDQYDRVVSFHLSTELSGNYNSAIAALNLMFEDEAQRIKVMDLRGVSISLGLVVKKAVELIHEDDNLDTLDARLHPYLRELFMGFTVEDLAWLKKGGRVSAFAAFLGGMLDIKPIIRLENAKLIPKDRMRGKKPALKRLVDMAESQYRKLDGNCDIWVAYNDNLEEAMVTRDRLADRLAQQAKDIFLAEVGATISVHTGPGSVCIAMSPRVMHYPNIA
jgi:DegV family protein with EDD domain